uniref:Pyrroline-5-carboxylate reductase n=1 Tax=Panagrolaimus sp. JU765 TaxID=591449 RepID=A0AC34QI37_9BILA
MAPDPEPMEDAPLSELDSMCRPEERRMLVFGGGKMAISLVEGIVKAGLFYKENIFISNRTDSSSQVWKDLGYQNAFKSNAELTEACWSSEPKFWVALIAVKPQTRFALFDELKNDMAFDRITRSFVDGQLLVISVLAGVDTGSMRNEYAEHLFYTGPILRVNPNVCSSIGSGTTLICSDLTTPRRFVEIGKEIFSSVGIVREIPEPVFDAACAISGSGPAFIFTIIEAIADGGVAAGLTRELATELASSMVRGSGDLVLQSKESPGKLKGDVCSPAGTTIAGIRELEKNGVRNAFIEAIIASTLRAKELK